MRIFNHYNPLNRSLLKVITLIICFVQPVYIHVSAQTSSEKNIDVARERISINDGWHFFKYDSNAKADDLIYDVRPKANEQFDNKPADAKPTEAVVEKYLRNSK